MDPGGEKTARSLLDKHLAELTEEDIAQLTREDCRRFLKDKGMRRPSWNKSQAIQQVISLKALLEGRRGCDDCPAGPGIFQKTRPPPSSSLPSYYTLSSAAGSDALSPALAKEPSPSPYRRRNPIPPLFSACEPICRIPVAGRDQPGENCCLTPRVAAKSSAGQMTIFYDGRVNIYDGVTEDQARAILELAASPGWYDDVNSPAPVGPNRPPVPHFRSSFLGPGLSSAAPLVAGIFPTLATGKLLHHHHQTTDGVEEWRVSRQYDPDSPPTRKASLQRYREKRKDRFKGKMIVGGSTSSSMDMMFLSQKLRFKNPSEQSSQSNRFSPNMPRPLGTPARCSLMENRAQKDSNSIDLNDDGGGN